MIPETWQPAEAGAGDWLAHTADLRPYRDDLRQAFPDLVWTEVLHPAYRVTGDEEPVEVPWRDINAAAASEPTGGTQFSRAVGMEINEFENGIDDPASVWSHPPEQGTLSQRLAELLAEILSHHTTSSDGYAGVWYGWADMAPYRKAVVPVVEVFGREHLLFRSPIRALSGSFDPAFYRAANVWYPDDRRWLVVTEIDFWSTFIGGCVDLASDLRASGLELRTA